MSKIITPNTLCFFKNGKKWKTESFNGEGIIEAWNLFEGIDLHFYTFQAKQFSLTKKETLCIIFIQEGSVNITLSNQNYILYAHDTFICKTKDLLSLQITSTPLKMIQIDYQLNQIHFNWLSDLDTDHLRDLASSPFICKNVDLFLHFFTSFTLFKDQASLHYYQLKVLELLYYLKNPILFKQEHYSNELVEIIQQIHDDLVCHLDQRFTIEELSNQYLINPTTLKNAFKSVYGTSIASHVNIHRLKKAQILLVESHESISEIAKKVGYKNPSKFTESFKHYCHMTPNEYRKQNQITQKIKCK